MKIQKLIVALSFLASAFFSLDSFASACSAFNGSFIDAKDLNKQILRTVSDCNSLSWQTNNVIKTIYTDGIERKLSSDYLLYDLYVTGTFKDGQLILNYRLEDALGQLVSQTKTVFEIEVGEYVVLVETNYLFDKLQAKREYFRVH
jgi:hypothetical protein